MARKMKRYEEGGDVREGKNENIGDDTRSRAMAWLKKQQEDGGKDETTRSTRSTRATKVTPKSREASVDTSMDETARLARRSPSLADRSVPSDLTASEVGSGGYGGPGMAEVGRNVSNTLNALGPGIAGAASRGLGALAGAGSRGWQRGKEVLRRAAGIKQANADRMARSADIVRENPIADYSAFGPQDLPFKRGGAVKKFAKGGVVGSASKRADGIAQRGKTRGKVI